MLNRMIGAALLRSDTYEDVENDSGATVQALLVVVIVAIPVFIINVIVFWVLNIGG